MSDDLVKDLRFWNGGIGSDKKMRRAADRIEQLEAALRLIASCKSYHSGDVVDIARAALEGKKDE